VGFLANLSMSAFTPTLSNLEPRDSPDNLSSAVLHSLSRPIRGRTAWGPVKSFILGGISFGILPLICWPRAFGRFVAAEQQQFWHLLEWLHIRTGDAEAAKLRDSVRNAGVVPTISIVPTILLVILAVNFLPRIGMQHGFNLNSILPVTYGFGTWPGEWIYFGYWPHLFKIWTVCLCVAYISHWFHVRNYISNVNQMLRRLNPILVRQQLPPMPKYEVGLGLGPAWLIAGLIGLAGGAVWAIPAAIAGGIQQRYCRRTSTRIRGELALRVNAALNRQRPPIDVPIPNGFRVVCRNQLCGKPLTGDAVFCSRCGTPVPRTGTAA
jgi:hypothetical protein